MARGVMSDAEWQLIEPFVVSSSPLGGRPPSDHRRTLDAIFWVMCSQAPWRELPEELGKWNSVHRQFARWSRSGLWDLVLGALDGSGAATKSAHALESSAIRAHGHARLKIKVIAARDAASRVAPARAAIASRSVLLSRGEKPTTQQPTSR